MAAGEAVKLFGMWASPYALRVRWALHLKGIEYYEYEEEDLRNKSPLLLQYNPVYKQIPVLVHGGKPIAQSLVIIEYIDETWKNNPLLPEDPYDRAIARFWAKFAEEKCIPAIFSVFSTVGEDQDKAIKEARECLKVFEGGLNGKKFFGGDSLGFTDIVAGWFAYWVPLNEEVLGRTLVDERDLPVLKRWFQDLLDIDAVKEILPPREKLLAHLQGFLEKLTGSSSNDMAGEAVKLLGNWASPFVLRVRWVLRLKRIEYEYVEEDLLNKSPRLLQSNPVYKKVPVLLHGEKSLAESLMIVEYLDETWKNNPMLPEDPYERATARFWAKYADEKLLPAILGAAVKTGEDQEKCIKEVHAAMAHILAVTTAFLMDFQVHEI
ncbi:hypothetical protein H6P81_010725 [Aristolochia fimbriata]|uniref:glutathione transferase n=1 Tax=Aristolochia fimbriata TaxID=158543 RepID=A0AAV7ERP1_ARIFI|nr:hypothetical protein H6P81_010725 [Aristolochia fimbriata]